VKLSVITPTHNPRFLRDAWESLKIQTHTDWEWIVSVNDPGHAKSVLEARAVSVREIVQNDPRVVVHLDHASAIGVGARKQAAFNLGTGDALIELDHDDILADNALAKIDEAFADPEVGFVYSDFADFDTNAPDQGHITYRGAEAYGPLKPGWLAGGATFYEADVTSGPRPGRYEFGRMPLASAKTVSTIHFAPNHVRAWRRSVYEQLGGHNPAYKVCDDHELLIRTYLTTKMVHIPEPLYLYRFSGTNTWAQNEQEIARTTRQLQLEYLPQLVLRECELLGMPAYDLGGALDPAPGWTVVDIAPKEDGSPPDVCADLRERWPFEDNSVGAFRAYDFLEHLPNRLHTLQEIHRCLRPGGWLLSLTPSTDGRGAWQDPTHVSFWNENCVAPETKVLCADFSWRRADELKKGDEIIAFDERPNKGTSRGKRLNVVRMRRAFVEANKALTLPSITVHTDKGPVTTASNGHPWLVQRMLRNPNTPKDRKLYNRFVWVETKDLLLGDRLVFLDEPWERQTGWRAGWLAGMFDGEGCYHIKKRKDGRKIKGSVSLSVAQRKSRTLNRLKAALTEFGFRYSERRDHSGAGGTCQSLHILGGRRAAMRFLGMIGPERFMERRDQARLYDGVWVRRDKTFDTATVTKLIPCGAQRVQGVQTSTRTLITNGYFTHNSFWYHLRGRAQTKYVRPTPASPRDNPIFEEINLISHFPSQWHRDNAIPYVTANMTAWKPEVERSAVPSGTTRQKPSDVPLVASTPSTTRARPPVVFYTALYGKHTDLKEFDAAGYPFVCFTDDPELRSNTWEVRVRPQTEHDKITDPRLAAKYLKLFPPHNLPDHEISIWIDASIRVTDPQKMAEACVAALEGHDVAFFKHPERDNIYTEVIASGKLPKYRRCANDMVKQARAYKREGIPVDHGLYAGGVIARRNTPTHVQAIVAEEWWREIITRSVQDQISLPYVLWKCDVKPGIIPGSVYGTEFHTHHWTGPDR
jgi:SAM-dependent methyltransferase/glycosyltransferase involved in cell wall biosynthesis